MLDYALLSEDGRFHSARMERLSELIEDYDPYLELRWIPPDVRTEKDGPPFCIVHNPPSATNIKPYIVMYFDETTPDYEVLGRIYAGDNWHGNVLEKMEYRNKAQEDLNKAQRRESNLEGADLFHFLYTNRSKFYAKIRANDGTIVKLNEHRRRV